MTKAIQNHIAGLDWCRIVPLEGIGNVLVRLDVNDGRLGVLISSPHPERGFSEAFNPNLRPFDADDEAEVRTVIDAQIKRIDGLVENPTLLRGIVDHMRGIGGGAIGMNVDTGETMQIDEATAQSAIEGDEEDDCDCPVCTARRLLTRMVEAKMKGEDAEFADADAKPTHRGGRC